MTKWKYHGDVNLEYGGYFFDFSEWQHGYVPCVEVVDLDSGCGFRGAVAVESKTINGVDDEERIHEALSVIGAKLQPNGDVDDGRTTYKRGTVAYRMCIAYALVSYGHYDQERCEVLQLEEDGALDFDGWHATRYLKSLKRYVQKEFLA